MTEVKIMVEGVEVTTRRYAGWKEIMAYTEMGRKVIRRLEDSDGFPIHRIPGPRGKVFVYSDEVERWFRGRQKPQKAAYNR